MGRRDSGGGAIVARTWSSLWDHHLEIEKRWVELMAQTAIGIATERNPEIEADVDEVADGILKHNAYPDWWPGNLGRMYVNIKITREGESPDYHTTTPYDPGSHRKSRLGANNVIASMRQVERLAGVDFEGRIEVRVLKADSKELVGGLFSGDVRIGEKVGRGRGSFGSREARHEDDPAEYWRQIAERKEDVLYKHYTGSAALLHGSAAVIQATRGHNMPGWMQDGGGDKPWWQGLAEMAMSIAMPALAGKDADPFEVAQGMGRAVAQSRPGGPPRTPPSRMLTMTNDELSMIDPAGPPPIEVESGEYDGMEVDESDLVMPDYEEPSTFDDEEDVQEVEDIDDLDAQEPEEIEEEEEQEEEEEEPRRRSGNPLEGLSTEEAAKYIEEYVDRNPDKRGIMRLGGRMVKKFMKPGG